MAYVLLSAADFDAANAVAAALGIHTHHACGAIALLSKEVQELQRTDLSIQELQGLPGLAIDGEMLQALIDAAVLKSLGGEQYRVASGQRQLTSLRRSGSGRKSKSEGATPAPTQTGSACADAAEASSAVPPTAEPVAPLQPVLEEIRTVPLPPSVSSDQMSLLEENGVKPNLRIAEAEVIPPALRRVRKSKHLGITVPVATAEEIEEIRRKSPSSFAWKAYTTAYRQRYPGSEPLRNPKTNSQMLQLIKEVGIDDAERMLVFYVGRNDAFYTRAMHPLGVALTQAQKLVTEMRTGKIVTYGAAVRGEKYEETDHAFAEYIRDQEEVHNGAESEAVPGQVIGVS